MAKKQTIDDVKAILSAFSGLPVTNLRDDYTLQGQPLVMNSPQLFRMAGALRDYVKLKNPTATLLASEIRKSGMTVRQLIDLIDSKI